MSNIDKTAKEVNEILTKFQGNRWLMAEAILQMIRRESILTGNRLRRKYGEPEKVPEPNMYAHGSPKVEWLIDVPKEWTSLTGRKS